VPLIESVSLTAECIKWSFELYKIVRSSIAQSFSKDGFRTLSSLTTLEFNYEGDQQVAHYVQDRRIVFTKRGILPPFLYGTDGKDSIDGLLINNMAEPFVSTAKAANDPARIVPENPKEYPKKYQLTTALLARSINGFTKPTETHSMQIVRWVGKSSVAIIFPDDKKPVSFGVFYRDHKDESWIRKHPGYEACFLRKTTRDRWALLWELNNIKPNRTYTLEWTWP
jgi:hypothetical protein